MRYYDDPELQWVAAGEETLDGMACKIITTSIRGVNPRVWIAPDGKLVKLAYQGPHPLTHAPGQMEITYSDFQADQGLLLPRREIHRCDGQEVMKITIESITLNPTVDPAWFKKP